MVLNSIGIVGLGLMGGSFGLGLRDFLPEAKIIGYDHNETHTKDAKSLKLVDEIAANIDDIFKCELIILAIPVDGIIDILKNIKLMPQDSTIIDLGSTKKEICENIPNKIRANFVATHPMTGTEKHGPAAAFDGLYKNKTVVLCDIEKSGSKQVKTVEWIYKKLGMSIIYMDSDAHDKHAAFISHMPHAISFALANSVMKQEDPKSIIALAGGGFRDMSRIAKSSPVMWESIFKQNKTNVLESIGYFIKELEIFEELLENEDYNGLRAWMSDANKLHDIL
ncbi:MAG: prephenate dehydrogenase [Epsilonproteobacteria bacterium]|nr:prephenate dehydrogenase [Campylobacterota bacterium]